jgi:hypothetical protein
MAKIQMVKKHFLPFGCPPAILIKDNIQTLLEGIKMTKKNPIIFFSHLQIAVFTSGSLAINKKTYGQIED